ncbi:MAG: hypothetical protein H6807_15865 [Planctomycetes bacterium]|nr:hypothetical protein [Planctomycetota bacterium]
MLEEILVENLLIIDRLAVELHAGFNVISGETGVGKSLLLSSVGLLLGAKIEVEVADDREMRVEGRFRLDARDRRALADVLGREPEEDELVVRVVKKGKGPQRCYADGGMISRRELAAIGSRLVDVHGQRDMQKLLDRREHAAVLDLFADTTALADEFAAEVEAWRAARRQLQDRLEAERRLVDRLDLLRFQRDELEAAKLQPDEKEGLEARHRKFQVARRAAEAAGQGAAALEEEGEGVIDRLNLVGKELGRLADRDPELGILSERAYELADGVGELVRELQDAAEERGRLDEDPAALAERLDLLNGLERKYRRDLAGLLVHLDEARAEIERLEAELDGLGALDSRIAAHEARLLKLGAELADRRGKAGKRLARAVEAELAELKMPHARFRVDPGLAPERFEASALQARAFGDPGFELRSNPGSPFAALEDAASGGELSRVLLALKSVLADKHNLPLMIFDEIETGVGPRLGLLLGRKLKALSGHRQVLCITHLPQIAAHADRHLKIDKEVKKGQTRASVAEIRDEDRLAELAVMLGGGDLELARAQARKLLEEAGGATVGVEGAS